VSQQCLLHKEIIIIMPSDSDRPQPDLSKTYQDDPLPPKPPKKIGTIARVFLVLLTIPAALFTLVGLVFLLTEQNGLPLLLGVLALLLVVPGLGVLRDRIPLFRIPVLNMFFSVVLMFATLVAMGSSLDTAEQEPDVPDVPPITLANVQLCTAQVEDTCDGDYNLFTRDSETLHIVGTPENFAPDTPITLDVDYTPRPEITELVKRETFPTPLNDAGLLAIAYRPETLPVGSYELRLSSDGEGFETVTKTFDVWPSADWIDAIANQTKPEVVTEIKTFKLCIDEQVETEPPPTDEPTTGKYTGCAVDQSEFTSDVTALKADADLEDAIDGEQLTFLWFYQRQDGTWEEINKNTVDLQQSLDGFLFTLQGDFSPGEYEVLALLEARNRPPLRHAFTIAKAE
jgi:hypothetical protein